jgi:sulfatase maturation enzyme AslB (radical SAM superfamily)
MKHIACSKIWTDINLNIPTKEIRNCCKKQPAKLSVDELKSLGIDSFTKHSVLIKDKQFLVDNNELPNGCYYCKSTWPNAIWNNWNIWKNKEWSAEELVELPSKDYVKQIEIMLGITCNQTCMYCTAEVSSAWANLKQIPIVTDTNWQDTALKNLYGYIETNRCNDSNYLWYNFLGGEPLLEPKIFKVIETIIDIHSRNFIKDKKIVFNMTTNLNVKPKTIDRYIELV